MSYLSTSENVSFSGIPQNISDASCATQYKMAVESVAGPCGGDMNIFLHENSGEEQAYLPHFNDNFFHPKFKIDSNELYTFQDSDIIAGEITVCHTEDNFIFTEGDDVQDDLLHNPCREPDISSTLTNGVVKEDVPNGHYVPLSISTPINAIKDNKTTSTKVLKAKIPNQTIRSQSTHVRSQNQIVGNDNEHQPQTNSHIENRQSGLHTSKSINTNVVSSNKPNHDMLQAKSVPTPKKSRSVETFLDVFKREQGVNNSASVDVTEIPPITVKTEPGLLPPAKIPVPPPKKTPIGKSPSHPKVRRGRGPAVHEALQRIPAQNRAVPILNRSWHAPGEDLFECGPLDDKQSTQFRQESSSSDDDYMPNFETGSGPVCVEESAAESRGARLALRRAALRRHVAKADIALQFATDHQSDRALASLIKKQLSSQCRALPTQTVNHLLAMRGMSSVLTSQEHRKLRESGWSGGESGKTKTSDCICMEDKCTQAPLPCARFCLAHITQSLEQRLYASCTAVFAGGERCKQALLPLQDQSLCAEHAWKRVSFQYN